MVLTGAELSRSYLKKAQLRREILTLLANREGWSDLVREAQELGNKFRQLAARPQWLRAQRELQLLMATKLWR